MRATPRQPFSAGARRSPPESDALVESVGDRTGWTFGAELFDDGEDMEVV